MQEFTVVLFCACSATYKDYEQTDFVFLSFTTTLHIKCFLGYFNIIN